MTPFSAVIPAAGLGTRFLPFTKSVPKELIPIVQTPALDLILQELVAAGCTHVCIIISPAKKAVRDYLQRNNALDRALSCQQQESLLQPLYQMLEKIRIDFVTQKTPRGLGHALLHAQDSIITDSFVVVLPDDLIISASPLISYIIKISAEYNNALILTVQEMAEHTLSSYGVVGIDNYITESLFKVNSLIEKPKAGTAPSHYAIIGRYVLPRAIFTALSRTKPGYNGEIQLTDAIKIFLKESATPVLASIAQGQRFDIGTPAGWLLANNYYARQQALF